MGNCFSNSNIQTDIVKKSELDNFKIEINTQLQKLQPIILTNPDFNIDSYLAKFDILSSKVKLIDSDLEKIQTKLNLIETTKLSDLQALNTPIINSLIRIDDLINIIMTNTNMTLDPKSNLDKLQESLNNINLELETVNLELNQTNVNLDKTNSTLDTTNTKVKHYDNDLNKLIKDIDNFNKSNLDSSILNSLNNNFDSLKTKLLDLEQMIKQNQPIDIINKVSMMIEDFNLLNSRFETINTNEIISNIAKTAQTWQQIINSIRDIEKITDEDVIIKLQSDIENILNATSILSIELSKFNANSTKVQVLSELNVLIPEINDKLKKSVLTTEELDLYIKNISSKLFSYSTNIDSNLTKLKIMDQLLKKQVK
jgi:chromosome segregation ATPase